MHSCAPRNFCSSQFLLMIDPFNFIWKSVLRDFFKGTRFEIALLSQFEHENIVQYYGADKVLILVLLDLPGLLFFSTYTLLVPFWGKKRKDTICIALADDTRDQSKIRMNNDVITPFKNSVVNMALPCGSDSDEFLIDGLDDDSSHRGASRFWRSYFKFI
ncbi:hypothetical protein ACSBR2_039361 [Camellia fascicularis]